MRKLLIFCRHTCVSLDFNHYYHFPYLQHTSCDLFQLIWFIFIYSNYLCIFLFNFSQIEYLFVNIKIHICWFEYAIISRVYAYNNFEFFFFFLFKTKMTSSPTTWCLLCLCYMNLYVFAHTLLQYIHPLFAFFSFFV